MIDVGFSQLENSRARSVADGHAPRGDAADDSAQRKRREHRREREHEVHAATLARTRGAGAQRVGGAAHDDADAGDEQRHRQRGGDRREGASDRPSR